MQSTCGYSAAVPAGEHDAMSLDFDVFAVYPKPIPRAVPGLDEAVGPATWPPSTSTLISDDDSALLVDCLITEPEARKLAAWIKSRDRAPGYVYVTHPHADHFLGLPEILAAFPEARPVALAEAVPAMQGRVLSRSADREARRAGAAGGYHDPGRRLGGHGDPGRDHRHRALQRGPCPPPRPGRLGRCRL